MTALLENLIFLDCSKTRTNDSTSHTYGTSTEQHVTTVILFIAKKQKLAVCKTVLRQFPQWVHSELSWVRGTVMHCSSRHSTGGPCLQEKPSSSCCRCCEIIAKTLIYLFGELANKLPEQSKLPWIWTKWKGKYFITPSINQIISLTLSIIELLWESNCFYCHYTVG